MHHHSLAWLLLLLPLHFPFVLGLNWTGFGSAVSNIGSAVTQSLAQAGVFGTNAQNVALYRPLAPPAAEAGVTAYSAATLSTPTIIIIGLILFAIVMFAFVLKR